MEGAEDRPLDADWATPVTAACLCTTRVCVFENQQKAGGGRREAWRGRRVRQAAPAPRCAGFSCQVRHRGSTSRMRSCFILPRWSEAALPICCHPESRTPARRHCLIPALTEQRPKARLAQAGSLRGVLGVCRLTDFSHLCPGACELAPLALPTTTPSSGP